AVMRSCLTGDSSFWGPAEAHARMCQTLPLRSFMPEAEEGWRQRDVHWIFKMENTAAGFREGQSVEGIFHTFHAYPFLVYTEVTPPYTKRDKEQGKPEPIPSSIVLFAAIHPVEVR